MSRIVFVVLFGVVSSCTYDDSPWVGSWSISGHVFWYGSGKPVTDAEVRLIDPDNPLGNNDVWLRTDDDGKYAHSSDEHQRKIRFDGTLDGRQFPVQYVSRGYPNNGEIDPVTPDMEQDIYLMAVGFLEMNIENGNTDFAYGKISGNTDSFTFFSIAMPHQQTIGVFAETYDSVQLRLYDHSEKIIRDKWHYFKVDSYGIKPLTLKL